MMDYNRPPYVPDWAEPLDKPKPAPLEPVEENVPQRRISLVLSPLFVVGLRGLLDVVWEGE